MNDPSREFVVLASDLSREFKALASDPSREFIVISPGSCSDLSIFGTHVSFYSGKSVPAGCWTRTLSFDKYNSTKSDNM